MSQAVTAAHTSAIDALHTAYVAALDQGDMAAWAATFAVADETSYFCISAENDRRGLPLALMYDDCRGRIDDRVSFVTKVWVGTYQPYRTRHFIQRLSCESAGNNQYRVTSGFMIMMTPEGGATTILTSGEYRDLIEIQGEGDNARAVFRERRTVYDADVLPRYIVFPF
ncbi:MAG: aromatic-ring-hydroxylating dioxygenase subunit beta [Rugosibacter sp.]|jgi:3-phenylpropionate/cinnamic acid dioxygenase small subunit|nr:aromatic-ring-hydroxylating dioxygenase subunit beta [Rugosibacter sp.]